MRIGIDAMGSDNAPATEVEGSLAARELLNDDDRIILVGDRHAILKRLQSSPDWEDFIEIQHADQRVGMNESPVEALRSKPNSSIAILTKLHAAGEIDGCISAGNTGAFVASAQMSLRRLPGVQRPGIAIVTPTLQGPVALCDVGANVSCRPQHLYQYGIMASLYLKAIAEVQDPRVGLLSIGEEDAKGNDLVKRTRELLNSDDRISFVGNVEGRDLFNGSCDVMVCDGFVGNVVLKLMEGMAEGVLKGLVKHLADAVPEHALILKKAATTILGNYDYNEYGGAPLLGVSGICIICHGASDYRGIKNAVRVIEEFSKHHVNEQIVQMLAEDEKDD